MTLNAVLALCAAVGFGPVGLVALGELVLAARWLGV